MKSVRAASTLMTAEAIYPMEPGVERFRLQDAAPNKPAIVTFVREATTEHGASIAVTEDDRRVEFLIRTDDGSIALTAVIDRAENALTLFEPPLTVMPPSLKPGETFESKAAMRVVALDDPTRQRERGTARRIIVNAADASIRVNSRTIAAARIDVHFTADLRFADADERTTMYAAPDSGVWAIRSAEVVTILGAFPKTTRRALVRE